MWIKTAVSVWDSSVSMVVFVLLAPRRTACAKMVSLDLTVEHRSDLTLVNVISIICSLFLL